MAKSFSWSFSKIKNFEECAFRHQSVDILKTVKEKETEQLLWGNEVHEAMKNALTVAPYTLPSSMASYQSWVDRVRARPGELFVEQKWAITKSFEKASWFAPDAWYRAIGDAVNIDKPTASAIVTDWKTGRLKPDNYRPQLLMLAMTLFANFPFLQMVRTDLVWLQEDDCKTTEVFTRADLNHEWLAMQPRVNRYELAVAKNDFPPMPGRLCERYCPVTGCQFNGKRQGYRR